MWQGSQPRQRIDACKRTSDTAKCIVVVVHRNRQHASRDWRDCLERDDENRVGRGAQA